MWIFSVPQTNAGMYHKHHLSLSYDFSQKAAIHFLFPAFFFLKITIN